MSRSVRACVLLLTSVLVICARAQQAGRTNPGPAGRTGASVRLPQLGDEVPDALRRHAAAKPCDVGDGHTDPCARVVIGHDRILIAWDSATHRATYLYSSTLRTDQDVRAGDLLGIEPDSPITPFPAPGMPHRFVTSDWCDTDAELSGQALWCAVMVPARPKSGKVIGFVQSLYLYLPLWDAAPMHRTAAARADRRRWFLPRGVGWG